MIEPDPCRDPVALDAPGGDPAVRRFAAQGFSALWRGERVRATDLTTDPSVVQTLIRAGRVEVDDDGLLVGVHGLATRPSRHCIEYDSGVVNTWCALDAVGIPAALAIKAVAVTSCPTCDTELRVQLVDGQPRDAETLRLWLPDTGCEHLVENFCNHANLYCDRGHLDTAVQDAPGRAATVADAAEIGRRMWADVTAVVGP